MMFVLLHVSHCSRYASHGALPRYPNICGIPFEEKKYEEAEQKKKQAAPVAAQQLGALSGWHVA